MNQRTEKINKAFLSVKPAGEPYVWFTGMGLALGLIMVVFLLGLIFFKGLEVFWPDRAAVLHLKESSAAGIQGSNVLAGVITKKQERVFRQADADEPDQSISPYEWQLHIGNKDVYGFNFIFIDVAKIEKVSYPKDLMRIERLEYGDAFAFPVALRIAGREPLASGHPDFITELHKLTGRARERWKKIRRIEKEKIGLINHKLEKLRLKEKKIARQGAGTGTGELESIRTVINRLKEQYKQLAAEAQYLRQQQGENILVYRLATGEQKELPAGDIVHFYFPNKLHLGERLSLFFYKMINFLTAEPREANTEGGVFPAIFGTFVMTILMSVAVTPFGVLAAIYLREYAEQGLLVRSVRIAVNNLAGVPSIVFGVFGLGFFVYFVGGTIDHFFYKDALPTPTFGTGGILWASLTLALLTVPVVIVSTEEALASVPRGMREGSLACGASKWQTIQRIVLPSAAPGILTGLILAMARGAGEVAPLMLVGVVKLAPNLPLDNISPFIHLERKFMHLGFHIYDLGFQSPDSEAAKPMVFATTLLLIGIVLVLNMGAIVIRDNLRKKYAVGAF